MLSFVRNLYKTFSTPIILFCLLIGAGVLVAVFYIKIAVHVEHDNKAPKDIIWSFDGPLGVFDKTAAQRGYQVYKEVCSGCHSLKRISFRNLTAIGFSVDETKVLAAEYEVEDGPNGDGEMYMRAGTASDYFVSPYANEKASRASNNGAFPPDLSLITKARVNGPDYIYSLLTGYSKKIPEGVEMAEGMHHNPYFPGGQIAMPSPLSADLVGYTDGTSANVDQMARDVVQFLQWVSEPEMEQRKAMGLKVLLYLLIFTVLFYYAKKRIWKNIK